MKNTVFFLLAAVLAAFYFPFPGGSAARIKMPVLADGSGVVTEVPQDRDELEIAPQKDAESEVPQERDDLGSIKTPQQSNETPSPQQPAETPAPEEEKKPRFDIRDYLIHRVF